MVGSCGVAEGKEELVASADGGLYDDDAAGGGSAIESD